MVSKNWDDESDGCEDGICDCDGIVDESEDYSVDERPNGDHTNKPKFYKCPDFPNCHVVTPFGINIVEPADMDHYLLYHDKK